MIANSASPSEKIALRLRNCLGTAYMAKCTSDDSCVQLKVFPAICRFDTIFCSGALFQLIAGGRDGYAKTPALNVFRKGLS